jgi:hypothetical protein
VIYRVGYIADTGDQIVGDCSSFVRDRQQYTVAFRNVGVRGRARGGENVWVLVEQHMDCRLVSRMRTSIQL